MEELRVLQAVRLDNATPTERLLQLRLRQCGDANPSRSTVISIAELICRRIENSSIRQRSPDNPNHGFERCRLGRAT